MFTLVGYTANVNTGGVLTYIPAIPDQHVRVEGYNIVVPEGMANLLGAYAQASDIAAAQVESPSLRRTVLLDLSDLTNGTNPSPSPIYFDAFYNPIPLDPFEPIRVLISEVAAGATQCTGLLWLGDGAQSSVTGEIYTVKCTSNTTLVPYTWTNGPLTIGQTLPAGRYQVVGMAAYSQFLIAARLVFVGGTWRPGALRTTVGWGRTPDVFRRGALGVWGEFSHDQPPTVDFLARDADTTETVFLDLIKIG